MPYQQVARARRPSFCNGVVLRELSATKMKVGTGQDRSVSWLYLHADADADRNILGFAGYEMYVIQLSRVV